MHLLWMSWLAAHADPSELQTEAESLAPAIAACRRAPASCRTRRDELSRALFVNVLQDWVGSGVVDSRGAGNLKRMEPALFQKLPDVLTGSASAPEPWIAVVMGEAEAAGDTFDPASVTEVEEAVQPPPIPEPAREPPPPTLDPEAVFLQLAPRKVKIDAFVLEPGLPTLPPPFVRTTMEQWTAGLDCRPIAKRRERCTFIDGVWYGLVLEGDPDFKARKLPAPEAIELVWNKRGRLSRTYVKGDSQEFRDAASRHVISSQHERGLQKLSANATREIGEGLETVLLYLFGGALEWERPEEGWSGEAWEPKQAPNWTMWNVASVAQPRLTTTAKPAHPDLVHLEMTGEVKETPSMGSAANTAVIITRVAGKATLSNGVVTHSMLDKQWTTPGTRVPQGHMRVVRVMEPWVYGSIEPADVPPPLLDPVR